MKKEEEINTVTSEYERRKKFVNNIEFSNCNTYFSLPKLYACKVCKKKHQSLQNSIYCYCCFTPVIEENFPDNHHCRNFSGHGENTFCAFDKSCNNCTNESLSFSMLFFPIYYDDRIKYWSHKTLKQRNTFIDIYRQQCVDNERERECNKLKQIECESCSKQILKLKDSKTNKCVTCVVVVVGFFNKRFPLCNKIKQTLSRKQIENRKNILDKYGINYKEKEEKIVEMIEKKDKEEKKKRSEERDRTRQKQEEEEQK